jgi:hypothetical protein
MVTCVTISGGHVVVYAAILLLPWRCATSLYFRHIAVTIVMYDVIRLLTAFAANALAVTSHFSGMHTLSYRNHRCYHVKTRKHLRH